MKANTEDKNPIQSPTLSADERGEPAKFRWPSIGLIVHALLLSSGIAFLTWTDRHYIGFDYVDAGMSAVASFSLMILAMVILAIVYCFHLNVPEEKRNTEKLIRKIFLACFIWLIAAGLYVRANSLLDKEPAVKSFAKVVNRYITPGRTTYRIIHVRINDSEGTYKFISPDSFYREVAVGDTIVLYIKPGFFKRKWLAHFERAQSNVVP